MDKVIETENETIYDFSNGDENIETIDLSELLKDLNQKNGFYIEIPEDE